MPPANTLSYHVAGPIIPQCNIGVSNAFVNLGVCEDGADLDFIQAVSDIKDDGGGGPSGFEVENIFLNAVVVIRFTLVPWAGNYVNTLRAMSQAGTTDGTMVTPGTLFGMNAKLPSLKIPVSATGEVDGPWTFTTCRVVRAGSHRASTRESKLAMEFRAFNFLDPSSATSIVGKVLYARS